MHEKLNLISLLQVAADLSGSLDLKEFLKRLLKVLDESIGADRILILSVQKGGWCIRAFQEANEVMIETEHPIPIEKESQGIPWNIFQTVLLNKKTEIFHDISEVGLSEMLCLPLFYRGHFLGILMLGRYSKAHPFTDKDKEVLETLSYQIASAYQSGTLYLELSEAEKNLKVMNEKLEIHTANLEKEVDERTTELREKNEKLERSLTALEKIQNEMMQQERLACLGALSHAVAEEISEPLNVINTLSEKVKSNFELYVEARKSKQEKESKTLMNQMMVQVGTIQELSKHADKIVMSMLQHSAPHRGDKEETELNDLINENVKLIRKQIIKEEFPQISIETNLDPNVHFVNIVPLEVGRAFFNILDYACNSLMEKITKEPTSGYHPVIQISTQQIENLVEVVIKDNAGAISKEDLPQLFIPFSNVQSKGTGLGLSIAHDIIVKEHEGKLDVKSEEGKYSEFIIKLPLRKIR